MKARVLSVFIFVAGLALLLGVAFGAKGSEVSAADTPPQFRDVYRVLEDGSILVTRTRLAPEQALRATQACTKTPPILSEPADGAQLDTLVPDYFYFAVPGTSEYNIEVSTSTTFSNTVLHVTYVRVEYVPGQRNDIWSDDNLLPNTTYYWRMSSVCENDEEGAYSPVWSFRSAPSGGTILPDPALLAPDDGATVGSVQVTFVTEQVSGAERCQYRYSSDLADWDHMYTETTLGYRDCNVHQDIFEPEETLYWRAAARNSYAWGTPSASRSFTTPPVTATITISPDSGGTLTPDPGNISIQFPPGAVTATTTLSYTLQPQPSQNLANFRFAGRAFTLQAFDAHGQPITTFNQPFTLTIVYDDSDLLAADIREPSRLNLAFWNGSEWKKILPCTGCSVDTEHHTIIAVIDHLTEFALLAPQERFVFLPIVLK